MKKTVATLVLGLLTANLAHADISCVGKEISTGTSVSVEVSGNPLKITVYEAQHGAELLVATEDWNSQVLEAVSNYDSIQPQFTGVLELSSKAPRKEYSASLRLRTDVVGKKQVVNNYALVCKGQVSALK